MTLNNNVPGATGFMSAVTELWLDNKHMSLFLQMSPFWGTLAEEGRIQGSGYGTVMKEPVRVPTLTGPQLQGISNPYTPIEAQPMTGFTWAQWVLSMYGMDISWTDYDAKRAGGYVEMVNWIDAVLEQGHDKAMNKMMDDLWAAPENANSIGVETQIMSILCALNGAAGSTGNASPPAQASQINQTPYVLTSGATANTTVGALPRGQAGAAYWCTPLINGTPYGTPGATSLTTGTLNAIYKQALQDKSSPNLIVTVDQLEDKLQNLLQFGGTNGGTMFKPGGTADLAYDYIRFRRARIVFDRRCPTAGFFSGTSTAWTNMILCMNTNMFRLRMDGKKPKFKEVVSNRAIKEMFGTWFLALTAKNLGNCHSVALNVTA